jgi:hypothetical protein
MYIYSIVDGFLFHAPPVDCILLCCNEKENHDRGHAERSFLFGLVDNANYTTGKYTSARNAHTSSPVCFFPEKEDGHGSPSAGIAG